MDKEFSIKEIKLENVFHARIKKFQKLMRFKIQEILLVSSIYDYYLFEGDGRLYELIRSEYQNLNLSQAPEITHVTTEMIENIAGAGSHYHLAANLPNTGQIANLPHGCMVETPVHVNGAGIHPVYTGALPEPIAELLRREITVAQLSVDAAMEGSREKALQCLLLDPVITDIGTARKILDDYLTAYREYLPQFWE